LASKLFHAVVGVGISLGSVTACGGSVARDMEPYDPLPDANASQPEPEGGVDAGPVVQVDAGPPDAIALSDGSPEAALPDAAVVDAAEDSPDDAIVAAFCDNPWPITKSGREVCGPYDECTITAAPWCYGPGPDGSCQIYPVECVGAEWHCMGGASAKDTPEWPVSCQ
jgi:hypothetical protein